MNPTKVPEIDPVLKLVQPRSARSEVQFWTVLSVLPAFLLAARFGFDLTPTHALGASTAAWVPVLLLWWNRHAEREHARLAQAVALFDERFPVKGVGRPQAIRALADAAAETDHEYHAAALLLLAELSDADTIAPPPPASPRPGGFVLPDLEYKGPAAAPQASAPKEAQPAEPLLPDELQQAAAAQPALPLAPEPLPTPNASASDADGASEHGQNHRAGDQPEAYDYIPLEPHESKR